MVVFMKIYANITNGVDAEKHSCYKTSQKLLKSPNLAIFAAGIEILPLKPAHLHISLGA